MTGCCCIESIDLLEAALRLPLGSLLSGEFVRLCLSLKAFGVFPLCRAAKLGRLLLFKAFSALWMTGWLMGSVSLTIATMATLSTTLFA